MATFQVGDKVELTDRHKGKVQSVITGIVPKGEHSRHEEAYAIRGTHGTYIRTANEIRKIEQ